MVRAMRRIASLFFLVCMGGCFYEDPVFRIEVCGDVRVPEDIDAYRITVWDSTLDTELQSGTRELVQCPGVQTIDLPQVVELSAVSGDSWVRVQGLKNGVPVSRFDRRVRVGDDEDAEIIVSITRSCLGVTCAKGQTCFDGTCALADFTSTSEICTGTTPSTPDEPDTTVYCPDDEPIMSGEGL